MAASPLISADELRRLLEAGAPVRILDVRYRLGFTDGHENYLAGHLPGAVFAGPTARPQGLELLRKAVANQPKDSEIVLYCGCCPFDKCPNVRPAFEAMRALGFGRVKVLFIPVNLVKDWVEKGYPITRPGGK